MSVRVADRSTRYRLDVVAPCVTDAVTFIGGWMFDRVMNGWDVHVVASDEADSRPLRILGVKAERALQRSLVPSTLPAPEDPSTWAIATTAFAADSRVREATLSALKTASSRVVLWGSSCPAELDLSVSGVTYDLSAAAVAFKRHALYAANAPVDSAHCPEMIYAACDTAL
jgi:hypothetical protein